MTLLYSGQFLTHESDNLFIIDKEGDLISPLPFPSPMKSLVFEKGEVSLKEFITNNHLLIPIIQKVHILGEIVAALEFLHSLHIVHFDLKPENIVCFSSSISSSSSSSSSMSSSNVRWKLIDFDSSYDVSGSTPIVIRSSSVNNNSIRVTEEYICPEIMKILNSSSYQTNHITSQ